jgi:hypothetical protein
MDRKTVVKVPLDQGHATDLSNIAASRKMSRSDLCREVLIDYLKDPRRGRSAGTSDAPNNRDQVLISVLQEQVRGLEKDKEMLAAALEKNQYNLRDAISKVPAQIAETTEHKPRWWEFWKGKG